MTSRTLADALRWTENGTALFLRAAPVDGTGAGAPSALPGWSRQHVLAHVAANADALRNLVRWASTGERTPMYPSPEARAAGIERGVALALPTLLDRLRSTAEELDTAMSTLDHTQWRATVVTAQGRHVPATEIAWLRAREVNVHAVDLATGTTWLDLPDDFMIALCDDVVAMRSAAGGPALTLETSDASRRWNVSGEGDPTHLVGRLAEVTAYLTGRSRQWITSSGEAAPTLAAWL